MLLVFGEGVGLPALPLSPHMHKELRLSFLFYNLFYFKYECLHVRMYVHVHIWCP